MSRNKRTLRRLLTASAVAAVMLTALSAPATSADEDVVLQSGTWTKVGYPIAGTWSLVERGAERLVKLNDKFKTKAAPDLKVFLSPLPLAQLNGDNATDGALFVGQLSSNKGGQELKLPSRINLARFKTVIIHCEQYAKLWGGAALSPPAAR